MEGRGLRLAWRARDAWGAMHVGSSASRTPPLHRGICLVPPMLPPFPPSPLGCRLSTLQILPRGNGMDGQHDCGLQPQRGRARCCWSGHAVAGTCMRAACTTPSMAPWWRRAASGAEGWGAGCVRVCSGWPHTACVWAFLLHSSHSLPPLNLLAVRRVVWRAQGGQLRGADHGLIDFIRARSGQGPAVHTHQKPHSRVD